MPKLFGKDVPNWMLGLGVVLLGGLLYSAFGGDDAPLKGATASKAAAKKSTDSMYTAEDMTGPAFAVFTETPKNAFLPLVAKPGPAVSPSGFDASWAGGESGWGYTGYVMTNGKPQALLENSSTGEGDYVTTGQSWKSSVIEKVTPDTLVLSSSSGMHHVKLGEGSEHKGAKDVVQPIAPANPATALQGPIGGPPAMAMQPNANGMTPDQMNNQATPQPGYQGQGYPGRGRGRGRRGGGGGGGVGVTISDGG